MKYANSQRNASRLKIPQKIPFSRAVSEAVKTAGREHTKNRAEQISRIRKFTWTLKRTGFKNASNLGAGVDIAIETIIRGKTVRITADQKLADGRRHGDGAIETRIKNKELYNKADWIIVLNKQGTIEAFPAEALARFVKQNSGSLRFYERRKLYDLYSVRLADLYKYMRQILKREPIQIGLSKPAGRLLIKEMIKWKKSKMPTQTPQKKGPIYPQLNSSTRRDNHSVPKNPVRSRAVPFHRRINPGRNQK